jgi:hypothetical protein
MKWAFSKEKRKEEKINREMAQRQIPQDTKLFLLYSQGKYLILVAVVIT